MTAHELTEKGLDRNQRAALKLARLPEAKLRKLSKEDMRKAYEDAATDFVVAEFLSDEEHRRVAAVWHERREERRPVPIQTKKRKRRGDIEF